MLKGDNETFIDRDSMEHRVIDSDKSMKQKLDILTKRRQSEVIKEAAS